jgi:transitional endoplasmic reticulum ATPase
MASLKFAFRRKRRVNHMANEVMERTLLLEVVEAESRDVGRGLVRIDPSDMERLGVRSGEIVRIAGQGVALGRVLPQRKELRGGSQIQIDGLLRSSAKCPLNGRVQVEKMDAGDVLRVRLKPVQGVVDPRDAEFLLAMLQGIPIDEHSLVRATLIGNRHIDFQVMEMDPPVPGVITSSTRLELDRTEESSRSKTLSFEDIGGVKQQLARIREMIEVPLKFPQLFQRLGIEPPRGVLLYGPPGCGKTLIARAIAHEAEASFFTVSGPEIIHKHYGESEAHLRNIFNEASKNAPSIIFLDEIDAIAPKRENAAGDVERRVVAQLLTLMDGLKKRDNVIVIGATNLPNSIDPALRRPGRFDREIEISVPDRGGRRQILDIHTRGMPLAADVDLEQLADWTHGFVGADLESLCREAAMHCVRRLLRETGRGNDIPLDQIQRLRVTGSDFRLAFQSIEPSAIREVSVEVPNVRWEDIGGLEGVKEALKEALVWPLRYTELFIQSNVRPPRGLLLAGPPGCGKTMIAKAAATECGINFISIKGPELLSKYIGESERKLREVFAKARQAAPCLIFFDEIDGLCQTRQADDTGGTVSARVLSQLLAELDGVEELNGVFVLAATNRVDLVDPALRRFGRFETTIELALPSLADRTQILAVHLRERPLSGSIDVEDLARRTEGFSGADLAALCFGASRLAIRRSIEGSQDGKLLVPLAASSDDFEKSLAQIVQSKRPSSSGC